MRYLSRTQKQANRQRGFTLMEVLLYVAIVSVLAVFLSGSVVSLLRGRSAASSQSEVHDALRFAEESISQDIRNATAIATPASAGSSASTLVLTVSGNTITYDVSANVLRRQVNAGTPEPVTGTAVSISAASFTRLHNTSTPLAKTVVSIQTQITAAASNAAGQATYTQTHKFTSTMP